MWEEKVRMAKSGFSQRWISVLGRTVGALAVLGGVVLLYLAYIYMPPENRDFRSPYLSQMAARQASRYLEAGAFRLHYLRLGQGEPVIVLPGGGGWSYDVRHLIRALAPNHTVYALDPPGSGYTTPLAPKPDYRNLYTLPSVDQALLEFMDALGIRRASFVGNSWGGGYALYFAQRHPERVAKLVLLDGTGLDLPESWSWELAKWPVLGEVALKLTASPSYIRKTLERLYAGREVSDATVNEYFVPYAFHSNLVAQWVFERNLDWRVTERLIPAMNTPMLIVWGRQDTVLDPRLYVPRWRALAPHATIVVLDGAGHTPHNARPGVVNRLVLGFLGG